MRVQTEEWQRFIPGVRMYKGKKTLFWNGETLWDDDDHCPLIYDWEERRSWEVAIVLPGVQVIPYYTFRDCEKLITIIMADTVRRIEKDACNWCRSLVFVKLSRNLEFIGMNAFFGNKSLISIFIPPSCREIGRWAFSYCEKLMIFHVPQNTQLIEDVVERTKFLKASPFFENSNNNDTEEVNAWIKNINMNEEYELHRACSSFNPIEDIIYGIVKRKGLSNFQVPNSIGITPAQYLGANPYADVDQQKLIKRYISEMMGESICYI